MASSGRLGLHSLTVFDLFQFHKLRKDLIAHQPLIVRNPVAVARGFKQTIQLQLRYLIWKLRGEVDVKSVADLSGRNSFGQAQAHHQEVGRLLGVRVWSTTANDTNFSHGGYRVGY